MWTCRRVGRAALLWSLSCTACTAALDNRQATRRAPAVAQLKAQDHQQQLHQRRPSGRAAPVVEFTCPPGSNLIEGTPGDDVLFGTAGDDCILGGAGNDTIHGRGGDDFLVGGAGNDMINGGPGDDQLYGGQGADVLKGDLGSDILDGGDGQDKVMGGVGSDILVGGPGNDRLDGGPDRDLLDGGTGNDTVVNVEKRDRVTGSSGNDLVLGAPSAADPSPASRRQRRQASVSSEAAARRGAQPRQHGKGRRPSRFRDTPRYNYDQTFETSFGGAEAY